MSEGMQPRAKTSNNTLYGERLRDARLMRREKARDVAEGVKLSPERYSRLENANTTQVDPMLLRRLSVALDFPSDFYLTPPLTAVERGSLLFRAKKAMTRGEEDHLGAWARLIGDLLRMADERVTLPSSRLPRWNEREQAAEAALAMREVFGLQLDVPIKHLTRAVERTGVFVASLDFSSDLHAKNHDAFSTLVGSSLEWPLIVVRKVDSWERTRLSIAHELGHLVMHQVRRDGDVEREAYSFAAELLLPFEALKSEWPRTVTLQSLLPIKRKWGVSLAGLIEHAFRNGLLDADRRTNFYKQLSNRKDRVTGERWRIHEPGRTEREVEKPRLLATIAEAAFSKPYDYELLSKDVCSWPAGLIGSLLEGQVQKRQVSQPDKPGTDSNFEPNGLAPVRCINEWRREE